MNQIFLTPVNTYKLYFHNNNEHLSRKNVSFAQQCKHTDVFEKKYTIVPYDIREDLHSLEYSYKQIKEILDKKTGEGVKALIKESRCFNTADGLTFKNAGVERDSVSFEAGSFKNHDNTIRIIRRSASGEIKKGWLLQNDRVVKNYNPLNPNSLPNNIEYYSLEELQQSGINEDLRKVLSDLDPVMLKVRRLVIAQKDTHLKKIAAPISQNAFNSLARIQDLTDKVIKTAEEIPHATLYKLNLKFPDYKQIPGQSSYTFKNLGKDNVQINYSAIDSKKFGELQRLVIYDKEGQIKTGYLLQNNNIVSNFNPKSPTILPEKFYYADEKELQNPHYSQEFEEYLKLYSDEIGEYLKHITPDDTPAQLPDEYAAAMESVRKNFESIENKFAQMNNVQVSHTKTEYPDFVNMAGKRGYTFKNVGSENETVNIMRCKTKQSNDILKITVFDDKGDTKDYLLVHDGFVISNYNPKYPTMLAPVLKYYNSRNINNLSAFKYLEPLNEKISGFEQFIEEKITRKQLAEQEAVRIREEKRAQKKEEAERLKQEKQRAKEEKRQQKKIAAESISAPQYKQFEDTGYKKLAAECKRNFKEALAELNKGKEAKENFFKVLNDIRAKVEDYFSE